MLYRTTRKISAILNLILIFAMAFASPLQLVAQAFAETGQPIGSAPEPINALVTIPSNFYDIIDSGGPNDEVSQADLTRMGWDDMTSPDWLDLFWSWDSTDYTAQKGNACALFDTNGDGNVNFAVCAEIENVPAGNIDVVKQTSVSPLAVICSDAKDDRCTQPSAPLSFTTSDLTVGDLINLAADANLITDTDPFDNLNSDQNWPNDSTIRMKISTGFLPAGATMVNICTYPSLGITGNNDPKDCIVPPSSGYLVIAKVAPDGTTQSFDFTVNPGGIIKTITGSGSTDEIPLEIGTGYSVAETIPEGWQLDSASCQINGSGVYTGTLSGNTITDIEIQSGKITTCTFTDSLQQGTLTLIKAVDNLGESGEGYLSVSDFPLFIDGTPTTSGAPVSVLAGDHTIAETAQSGYSVGTWTCTDGTTGTEGAVSATVNVSSGENVTCTMTNTLISNPLLSISKVATETSYDAVDDVLNYTITATNIGNVTLEAVTVTDPLVSGLSCTPTNGSALAPGESMICTATHTVTQADLDAGHWANTSCVDDGPEGAPEVCDDEDVPGDKNPAIDVEKYVWDGAVFVDADNPAGPYLLSGTDPVFKFVVKNTGNVTLGTVELSDSPVIMNFFADQALTTACVIPTTLAPDATFTCYGSLVWAVGQQTDTATASVMYGEMGYSDTDDANYYGAAPTIEVLKTANPTAVVETGGDVTFTFRVTNTGNVPVSITSLSDSDYGMLTGDADCMVGTELATNGSYCEFAITRWVEGDYSGPDHVNVFTAHASYNGTDVWDDDDATVDFTDVAPTILVTKTA
nr:DUF11 domain-containing protein [Anaerolineae bacterium]